MMMGLAISFLALGVAVLLVVEWQEPTYWLTAGLQIFAVACLIVGLIGGGLEYDRMKEKDGEG